ncbi:MAG: hypothetical protein NVS2B6_16250 [Thermoleophilaceae bacterium]
MSRLTTGSGLKPRISAAVLRTQTDSRLIALAREGHEQAFTAIFDRYGRELNAHARRIVRADRADDVVQQTMLSAWMAMVAGPEIADLRAWLHRIVHNSALDHVAKRGYDDGQIPANAAGPLPTDARAEIRITATGILEAVASLSENQRRALTLTALQGLSGHETAQTMGMSETAVRQLVHRARSTVRSAVSAITPLPLIGWISGPEATDISGAGFRGGAGLAAGALKVVAVLGVGGTTLVTATHSFEQPRRDGGRSIRTPHRVAAASSPSPERAVGAAAQAASVPAGRPAPSGEDSRRSGHPAGAVPGRREFADRERSGNEPSDERRGRLGQASPGGRQAEASSPEPGAHSAGQSDLPEQPSPQTAPRSSESDSADIAPPY